MEITMTNVNKSYKETQALKDINLTINEGVFGILGPNGAGKTTLMRTLMALQEPDSGEIIINGIPITDHKRIRECVSYLPQEFSFYPSMTVSEAMDYMALLSNVNDKKERKQLIYDLLKRVNLLNEQKKKVKALSGGMKRRLGIAIALLKNPSILIVDEPTAGLDPEERVRFRMLLTEFAKDRIVLLSTHIVGDIEHSCKDIAILSSGKIIFQGERDQLVDEARGKVRQVDISHDQLSKFQRDYQVLSIALNNTGYQIRILTDENLGSHVEPTLEDAYLLAIGKNEQEASC